jgi:hypothetical protein
MLGMAGLRVADYTSEWNTLSCAVTEDLSRASFHIYDLYVISSGSEQIAEIDESRSRCLGSLPFVPRVRRHQSATDLLRQS